MAEEQVKDNSEQPLAVIPPGLMPIIAVIGVIIAIIVGLTQPEFNVIGWGGLGLAGLSIIAWVLLSPEQVRELLTGRGMRFGGVSVLVTAIFIVALVAIYVIIREQNLRLDVSQTDNFSLREEVRNMVTTIGADPTIPEIRIVTFYNVQQAGQRDRDEVLLSDIQDASNGKISFEFIDPDRNPLAAQSYEATTGSTFIALVQDDGTPDIENAEPVIQFTQEEIVNTILRVTRTGDFRAYFIDVENGIRLDDTGGAGLSELNTILVDSFRWTVEQVSLFDLTDDDGNSILNDPEANGEVMVIAGGTSALADSELQIITDYIDAGGDVIFFGSPPGQDGEATLLTSQNMSDYLWDNFGVRVRPDIVLDQFNSFSNEFDIIVNEVNPSSPVGNFMIQNGSGSLRVALAYPIQIREDLPPNVQVTSNANTSARSYAKSVEELVAGGGQVTLEEIRQDDDDPAGPFTVLASMENTETGSRIVIASSDLVAQNQSFELQAAGIGNSIATLGAFIWTTSYDEFFQDIPAITPIIQEQDIPLIAEEQDIRYANFVAVILLPFSILFLGVVIWWNGRTRSFE